MVHIKDGHKLTGRQSQCVIDISCLCIAAIGTTEIAALQGGRQGSGFFFVPIIQNIDSEFIFGIILRQTSHDGAFQNIKWFIHHRDEHIYRWESPELDRKLFGG